MKTLIALSILIASTAQAQQEQTPAEASMSKYMQMMQNTRPFVPPQQPQQTNCRTVYQNQFGQLVAITQCN